MAMCVSLALSISVAVMPVNAVDENLYHLSTTPPTVNSDGISVCNNNYPTSTWNLSTDGMYTVSGTANGSADIYTLYNFTGVDSISISLTNNSSSKLTVTLYKNGIIDTKKRSFVVASNSNGGELFTGLNEDDRYYFSFSAPCDFTGYIA